MINAVYNVSRFVKSVSLCAGFFLCVRANRCLLAKDLQTGGSAIYF